MVTYFSFLVVKIFHVHLDLSAHLGHRTLVNVCVQLVLSILMNSHQQRKHVNLVRQVANMLLSEGKQAIQRTNKWIVVKILTEFFFNGGCFPDSWNT